MIWEIARREILVRARTKAFRIVTAILVLLAIAGPLLILAFPGGEGGPDKIVVGVVGEIDPQVLLALAGIETDEFVVVVQSFATRELAETAVTDGDIDTALVADGGGTADGVESIYQSSVDPFVQAIVSSAFQQAAIADAGLSTDELAALFSNDGPDAVLLEEDTNGDNVGYAVAVFAVIFTFIGIQTYGALMVMSVIEEKSTRVIEVLLAHVKPYQLLAGKILGTAVIAIAQLLLLVGAVAVMLMVTQDIDVPGRVWASLPLILVTFILGFLLYAVLFAAGGSLLSRQEDSQQVLMPLIMPLLAAYVFGTTTVTNPDRLAVKVLSFVPFSSPIFLPIRTSAGQIEIWEVVLSLAVLAVSIAVLLYLGAKVFNYALLRTGTRVSIRSALTGRDANS